MENEDQNQTELPEAEEVESVSSEELKQEEPKEEERQSTTSSVEASEDIGSKKDEPQQLTTKKFISKLQRDRFQAENEARELREKVARLEELTGFMNDGVLKQYELNAKLSLDKARLTMKQAIELADTDAMIAAQEEMSRATAQLESLKMVPAASAPKQQQQPVTHETPDEVHPEIENWLSKNPWCDERHPDYDPEKAAEVLAYASGLDAALARQGRTDEYYTPQYFSKIDSYAKNYDQPATQGLQMKAPTTPVASVKSVSSNGTSQRGKPIQLTKEERDMARLLRIRESDYVRFKIADMKKQQEKGQYYGQ